MNPKVDAYLNEAEKWREEMTALRAIALDCGLTEELKWGKPCYTFEKSNVVLIIGFKEYCALLFCKGSLLKDAKGIMKQAGENTQAARHIRFTSIEEITKMKSVLKSYLLEAVEVEKSGLKVEYKKSSEFPLPDELAKKLEEFPKLKAAFNALTPGRQRGYFIYISGAKQSKTRETRVGKCIPLIMAGKGLND